MSAHTHIQQQLTYKEKNKGSDQNTKLYEFNAGTTAGDWYSEQHELGVPTSTMRDGTPRGYAFIHFQ